MATHIMIDLETFSTANDAAIVQIGAQVFDPTAEDDAGVLIGKGICLNVDPQAAIDAGARLDWSTLYWWMSNPKAFATLAAPGTGLKLSEALSKLSDYVNAYNSRWAKVWANGASFDPPVLETSFRRCRITVPWAYNNVLDVRTMKWLAPGVSKVEPEVAHNALSDAKAQALYVARCYRAIKEKSGAATREEEKPQPPAAASPTIGEDAAPVKSDLLLLYEACERHDWTHMMSDDPAVNRAGEVAEKRLTELARKAGSAGIGMLEAFRSHIWKNGAKPERPEN